MEQDASFVNLATNIRVKTIPVADTMLMEEGEDGDQFYIILKGLCEVIKSQ